MKEYIEIQVLRKANSYFFQCLKALEARRVSKRELNLFCDDLNALMKALNSAYGCNETRARINYYNDAIIALNKITTVLFDLRKQKKLSLQILNDLVEKEQFIRKLVDLLKVQEKRNQDISYLKIKFGKSAFAR